MSESKKRVDIPFKNILIYGMGMMGASLARAIRLKKSFDGTISGIVRTEKSATYIRNNNLTNSLFIFSSFDDMQRLDIDKYDFIILGLPILSVVRILVEFPSFNGILTDMSSTRREVEKSALSRTDLQFIGAHPMCGSEDTGPAASRDNLFAGRLCIITPCKRYDKIKNDKIKRSELLVEEFWQALGMETYFLGADDHDQLLAYLSHAPHMISSILTRWAERNKKVQSSLKDSPIPVTGGGFKGMARIAGSNPEMWTDILQSNRDNLIVALKYFREELDEVISELKNENDQKWKNWFDNARKARNNLCGYPENF